MRTGENNRNLTAEEKREGQKAARSIQRKLKSNIKKTHYPIGIDKIENSGIMLKAASARAVMKFDSLDAIAVTASRATFLQHHGFEGVKSNGKAMQLKPQGHFDFLSGNSPIIERLADAIGSLRAEEVTSKIKW